MKFSQGKGITTSEFWVVAFAGLFDIFNGLGLHFPDQSTTTAAICAIATNLVALLYAWLRTHIKIANASALPEGATLIHGLSPTVYATTTTQPNSEAIWSYKTTEPESTTEPTS